MSGLKISDAEHQMLLLGLTDALISNAEGKIIGKTEPCSSPDCLADHRLYTEEAEGVAINFMNRLVVYGVEDLGLSHPGFEVNASHFEDMARLGLEGSLEDAYEWFNNLDEAGEVAPT